MTIRRPWLVYETIRRPWLVCETDVRLPVVYETIRRHTLSGTSRGACGCQPTALVPGPRRRAWSKKQEAPPVKEAALTSSEAVIETATSHREEQGPGSSAEPCLPTARRETARPRAAGTGLSVQGRACLHRDGPHKGSSELLRGPADHAPRWSKEHVLKKEQARQGGSHPNGGK